MCPERFTLGHTTSQAETRECAMNMQSAERVKAKDDTNYVNGKIIPLIGGCIFCVKYFST
jgi:hypothetical protein